MWVSLVVIGSLFLGLAGGLVAGALHRQRVEVALLMEALRSPAGASLGTATAWSGRVKLAIAAAAAVVLGLTSLFTAVYALPS